MAILLHPESDSYFTGEFTRADAEQGVVEVDASSILAGTRLPSGCGYSTVLPDMDFETYSEAGYLWDPATKSWKAPKGATKKGIFAVGGAKYSEHHSTEVLSLAYDLKDQQGPRLWLPGMPPPADLFEHIAAAGLLEAWNCGFEYWIWKNVCNFRMGWPELPFWYLRDAMAKSRAFAMPGALGKATEVIGAETQKEKDGKRLITKFCCPRKPTVKDPRTRIKPLEDPIDAGNLYGYCLGDIKAEAAVSALCPDLSPDELQFELCTRAMNTRGVALDVEAINAGVVILDTALEQYNAELQALTTRVETLPIFVPDGYGGKMPHPDGLTEVKTTSVKKASEVAQLTRFVKSLGVKGFYNLDADAIDRLLKGDLPADARRALEIRQLVGSAGVKKLYAMQRMVCGSGRAHDLFIFHAARTGRDGGQDIQPQNLVKAGPDLVWCSCGKPFGQHRHDCPHCGTPISYTTQRSGWSWEAVPFAIEVIRTRELAQVERIFGNALLTLCGCIRGLFVAGPGKELICSDYSSIEAVVTAVLAGEEWRIEAFRRKEDIYLVSASKITGTTLEEYAQYQIDTGERHPDRQKIGKPNELALGFGGWLNGYRVFDDTDNFTDEQVINNIKTWRAASPMIVELWGGQVRGLPWKPERKELYGLEGMAIAAIQNPGTCYAYRDITYGMKGDALYCRLPSGRLLTYHRPRLSPHERWDDQLAITFEGWNSNPKMGPIGWTVINTYGGRLAENVIQAVARDYMRDAVPLLERAGYPVVLRVHDELVSEVPIGFGSIEEYETIMATPPAWAPDWPIRAAGGWRGHRYRKD